MPGKTKIEWATDTWNPVTGCSRVSPGCDNCYAITMSHRIESAGLTDAYDHTTRHTPRGRDWTGEINLLPERLDQPIRWTKPRRIFVNSMSDLFHPSVPFEFVDKVFAVMALADHHIFQVLTKRPERMADYVQDRITGKGWVEAAADMSPDWTPGSLPWPLPNVWLGTSVEDQERACERLPALRRCAATVRFLSCEPLLGPVDLDAAATWDEGAWHFDVDWVIVGGESGPGARPMHPEWARSIRDQCVEASVAFHFKQWGAWKPIPGRFREQEDDVLFPHPDDELAKWNAENLVPSHWMRRVGKKAAGRELDGRTWDEMPESIESHAAEVAE